MMLDELKHFSFSDFDTATLAETITALKNVLARAEQHYADLAQHSTFGSADSPSSSSPSTHPPISIGIVDESAPLSTNVVYSDNTLEEDMLQELSNELTTLNYLKTGKDAPDVFLYGDSTYVYSKRTENIVPHPLTGSPVVSTVLDIVNRKYGLTLNSVLVNRYSNKNVYLGWHKDDEDEVDNTVPIVSLSLGAVRRFTISDSKVASGRRQIFTQPLKNNSLFVMKPGLQNRYFHTVETGRSSRRAECGARYSLTFRRIITKQPPSVSKPPSHQPATPTYPPHFPPLPPQQPSAPPHLPPQPPHLPPLPPHLPQPPNIPPSNSTSSPHSISPPNPGHETCPTTLIFGSSLTKGLDEARLSERGQGVKVFPHPGARIADIGTDMGKAVHSVCTDCVRTVFIVAGGNDIQKIKSNKGFDHFRDSYEDVIDRVPILFPRANLNVMSLIPRKATNPFHMERMTRANDMLYRFCEDRDFCRFIKIFSSFLIKKKRFFKNSEMFLNKKLYIAKDLTHFSPIGNSVLAKVLIGVIYNPF